MCQSSIISSHFLNKCHLHVRVTANFASFPWKTETNRKPCPRWKGSNKKVCIRVATFGQRHCFWWRTRRKCHRCFWSCFCLTLLDTKNQKTADDGRATDRIAARALKCGLTEWMVFRCDLQFEEQSRKWQKEKGWSVFQVAKVSMNM